MILNRLRYSTTGSGTYRVRRVVQSLTACVTAVVLIALINFSLQFSTDEKGSSPPASNSNADTQHSPFNVTGSVDIASKVEAIQTASTVHLMPAEIIALIEAGKFNLARRLLLEQASVAIDQSDDLALAKILSHLGELSLLNSDIDTAEVYLAEALDLATQTGDDIAGAGVYIQFGRLHLIARQRARLASYAYDTLLVARWKINHGQFFSIEPELHRSAEDSLALNRFGAAASAYETLFKGYSKQGDYAQAERAGSEAVKLLAASGRKFDAQALVENMRQHGFSDTLFTELEAEIATLGLEYEQSVKALGAARDYEQLYNQLQARGDVVNAWRFRQQAIAASAKASARAQYRRQPDVLAELYRSNSSMEDAKNSFQHAREVFLRHGMDTGVLQDLQSQIF